MLFLRRKGLEHHSCPLSLDPSNGGDMLSSGTCRFRTFGNMESKNESGPQPSLGLQCTAPLRNVGKDPLATPLPPFETDRDLDGHSDTPTVLPGSRKGPEAAFTGVTLK